MLFADPNSIPVTARQSHMPLQFFSAFPAYDHAGEWVPVPVAWIFFSDFSSLGPKLQQGLDSFKIFFTDDRFVVVFNVELISFTPIDMTFEPEV